MNNEYDAFEFATISIRILLIICAVAFLSCAIKSRLMFFAGLCGSLMGLISPAGHLRVNSLDYNVLVLERVKWRTSHCVACGLEGALLACGIVFAIHYYQNPRMQFSIRALLLVTGAAAIIIATCQLEVWWPKI